MAEALPVVAAFDDVPATHWAAKYIAYCQDAGYIAGVGGNKFNPTGELTGYAFGKMMLCVLGYDAQNEGFTGDNWQIHVATAMESAGINDEVEKAGSIGLTREEAAQFCYNALQANMVWYDGGTEMTVNGVTFKAGATRKTAMVSGGNAQYGPYASTNAGLWDAFVGETNAADNILQLGEKLYGGKLVPTIEVSDGHVGHSWALSGKEVVDFESDDTVLVTVAAGTAFDKLITKGETGYIGYGYDSTVELYENGVRFTTGAGGTGIGSGAPGVAFRTANAGELAALITEGKLHDDVGDVIEFIDNDNDGLYDAISITEYALTKVTATKAATASADATVTIPTLNNGSAVKVSAVRTNDTLAKDDIVLAATIQNAAGTQTDCYKVYKATVVTGQMTSKTGTTKLSIDGGTAKKITDKVNGVVVNGSTSLTAAADFATYNKDTNFYLDAYDNVVAAKAVAEETNYAAIDSIAWVAGTGVSANNYAEAKLVLTSGETVVAKIASINGYTPVDANTDEKDLHTGASGNGEWGVKNATQATVEAATVVADWSASGTGIGDENFAIVYNVGASPATPGTTAEHGRYIGINTTAATNANLKNNVFKYTINSDGEYVLTSRNEDANITMAKGTAQIAAGITANTSTVYVYKTGTTSPKWTVYTGYANAPSTAAGAPVAAAVKSGYAEFVYVDATGTTTSDDNSKVIVFLNTTPTTTKDGTTTLYGYNAAIDGVVDTYNTKLTLTNIDAGVPYDVSVSESTGYFSDKTGGDGNFTNDAAAGYQDNITAAVPSNGTLKISEDSDLVAGSYALTYGDGVTVYLVNTTDHTMADATISDVAAGDLIYFKPVSLTGTDAQKTTLKTLYIIRPRANVQTTTADLTVAEIKAGADGMYHPGGVSEITDAGTNAEKILIFKYTADVVQNYTLTIKYVTKADGTADTDTVYTETLPNATVGGHIFYIQTDDNSGNVGNNYDDWADGTPDAGTYSYKITGANGVVYLEGTFTIASGVAS